MEESEKSHEALADEVADADVELYEAEGSEEEW
jgi:hypothetical protein